MAYKKNLYQLVSDRAKAIEEIALIDHEWLFGQMAEWPEWQSSILNTGGVYPYGGELQRFTDLNSLSSSTIADGHKELWVGRFTLITKRWQSRQSRISRNKEAVTVELSPQTHNSLRLLAHGSGKSKSAIVEELISKEMAKQAKKEGQKTAKGAWRN